MNKFRLNILSLILFSIVFFISSCSEDTTNPSKSDLNGTWSGEMIQGFDTVRYSCTITEAGKIISGTANLYAFHKKIEGGTTTSETIGKINEVQGEFNRPSVKISFISNAQLRFEGQLSEDKLSFSGTIFAYFEVTDYHGEYIITLNKQ